MKFEFRVQHGSHAYNNLSLLEAHVKLGRIAGTLDLAIHVHEGDWSGNNVYSVAYLKHGDVLLDAVAYVKKMT